MFHSYLKALIASREGKTTFAVMKTNEFVIYGNNPCRFQGTFTMFQNGKEVFKPVAYFEARC